MAIKAGQILHVANQFVVDRIQTAGGTLNIPQEKVYELGNYQSVGIVRDIPDLTFSLESLNVDTEVEALLTGSTTPGTDAAGTKYELINARPLDIVSPWKSPNNGPNRFHTVHGVAVPALALESASWRYGLTENAGQTFSLRGDSIFYVPGVPWQDVKLGSDVVTGVLAFDNGPGLLYKESGTDRYALSVTVYTAAGEYRRLVRGTDYTDDTTGVTFTGYTPAASDSISVVYGSATQISAPVGDSQTGASPFGGAENPMHEGTTVKPAAIRGKDIDVFFSTAIPGVDLGSGVGAAHEVRWDGVQSATVDWSVTLEDDREFGNYYAVCSRGHGRSDRLWFGGAEAPLDSGVLRPPAPDHGRRRPGPDHGSEQNPHGRAADRASKPGVGRYHRFGQRRGAQDPVRSGCSVHHAGLHGHGSAEADHDPELGVGRRRTGDLQGRDLIRRSSEPPEHKLGGFVASRHPS